MLKKYIFFSFFTRTEIELWKTRMLRTILISAWFVCKRPNAIMTSGLKKQHGWYMKLDKKFHIKLKPRLLSSWKVSNKINLVHYDVTWMYIECNVLILILFTSRFWKKNQLNYSTTKLNTIHLECCVMHAKVARKKEEKNRSYSISYNTLQNSCFQWFQFQKLR